MSSEEPERRRPPRPRLLRLLLAALGVVALVAVLTFVVMRRTAQAWPPAYEQAVAETAVASDADLDAGKQLVESRASAFYSDSQALPEWGVELPIEELNAWLATRLRLALAEAERETPAKLREPRVWIDSDLLVFGAQTTVGPIDGVLSIGVRPSVTDRGEILLDFVDTRVGNLPVPATGVAEHLRRSFVNNSAPLRWVTSDTRTVAMLDPGRLPLAKDRSWRFTRLELTDESIRLACVAEEAQLEGSDEPRPSGSDPPGD